MPDLTQPTSGQVVRIRGAAGAEFVVTVPNLETRTIQGADGNPFDVYIDPAGELFAIRWQRRDFEIVEVLADTEADYEPSDDDAPKGLAGYTRADLATMAAGAGIDVPSRATKAEIITLIEDHEAALNADPDPDPGTED